MNPTIFVAALINDRVNCPTCGYDAPALTVCTECGRHVPDRALYRRLRRWRVPAVLLLVLPFLLEVIAIAFDRSDLGGLPGEPPWCYVCAAAWLLGPLCVLPMAALLSAFWEARVSWYVLLPSLVLYGVCVVGAGLGLAITLYGMKYW